MKSYVLVGTVKIIKAAGIEESSNNEKATGIDVPTAYSNRRCYDSCKGEIDFAPRKPHWLRLPCGIQNAL